MIKSKPVARSLQPVSKPIDALTASAYVRDQMPVVLETRDRFKSLMAGYDSIYAASFRFAQFNLDQLINQVGFDKFDEMLTMAACRAPFDIKRYAILSDGWDIVSAIREPEDPDFGKADELAQFTKYVLKNIRNDQTDFPQDFLAVLFELLRGCWDGCHVSKMTWKRFKGGKYSGKTGLEYIASKPAQEIGWDLDLRTMALINVDAYSPLEGYQKPLPVEKVLIYTHNPKRGLPYGDGDGRSCYKHWWILDGILKFWTIGCERFGSPFLVVKYPLGDTVALAAASAAIDSVRSGSSLLLPENCEYEVVSLDAKALEGFKMAADWHVQQIATAVLGNTLTTGTTGGTNTNALGKVHENTQQFGFDFTRKMVEGVLSNQLVRRLIRYNYGDDALDLCPMVSLGKARKNLLALAQAFGELVQIGNVAPTAKLIRDEMDLPPISPEEQEMLDQAQQYADLVKKTQQIAGQKPQNVTSKPASGDGDATGDNPTQTTDGAPGNNDSK